MVLTDGGTIDRTYDLETVLSTHCGRRLCNSKRVHDRDQLSLPDIIFQ